MRPFNRIAIRVCAALTAVAFLSGCGHSDADGHNDGKEPDGHKHETETGVSFNAKRGLSVPRETAEFIGLQLAEVEERRITSALLFSAQVYRTAKEAQFVSLKQDESSLALASGNVSLIDASRLAEGQTVSVTHAENRVALGGRIVKLRRDLQAAAGQVEVLLAISDGPLPLASGAFVSVTVPFGEKKVLSVPLSSVLRTTEGDFVYTASGDHFMRAAVRLGVVNDEFAEVTEGLYPGDQIVVQPTMTLWMAELQSLRGGKACADGH